VRGFLIGLGAGAVLALLFAPRRGDETREQLRSKANDLMDSAKEKTDQFKAVATKIQDQVGNLRSQKTETEEA
jgi:gas vesicle protein